MTFALLRLRCLFIIYILLHHLSVVYIPNTCLSFSSAPSLLELGRVIIIGAGVGAESGDYCFPYFCYCHWTFFVSFVCPRLRIGSRLQLVGTLILIFWGDWV